MRCRNRGQLLCFFIRTSQSIESHVKVQGSVHSVSRGFCSNVLCVRHVELLIFSNVVNRAIVVHHPPPLVSGCLVGFAIAWPSQRQHTAFRALFWDDVGATEVSDVPIRASPRSNSRCISLRSTSCFSWSKSLTFVLGGASILLSD
jgi:hypothetical protein